MPEKPLYTVEKAIESLKKNCKCKFDSTIEVHINLNLDVKGQNQTIRFTTTLPHGTGKEKRVAVFATSKVSNADLELTEEDLDKIQKGVIKPKIDFDILVAEPQNMPKLAKIAKILGPAGVMPNPKVGTVTENVKTTVEQIKKGKIEVRTEPNASIIHTIIGKRSFDNKKLSVNFEKLYTAIKQNKPQKAKPDWIKSVFITTTMGPSTQIDLTSL